VLMICTSRTYHGRTRCNCDYTVPGLYDLDR
jgi:hypothetical protein